MNGLQTQLVSDFRSLLTLKRIGGYDQHVAGVEHFSPPSDKISLAEESQPYPVEFILSAGPVATSSGWCSPENACPVDQSTRRVPQKIDGMVEQ